MHTITLNNFRVTTSEALSNQRQGNLFSAVMLARGVVATARAKTFEALACTMRPGVLLEDLPPRFLLHVRKLFRLPGGDDAAFLRALGRLARLMQVLDTEIQSSALCFKEYGTDAVTTVADLLMRATGSAGFYQPGDLGYVRAFSLTRASNYQGHSHVEACLNTNRGTGNPNDIMIRLSALDGRAPELVDTIVHESTHKFLGTVDDGMVGATFAILKDDGLAKYLSTFPGMPLPFETPGFTAMTTDQAMGNAYLLAAYIMYLPEGDITARTEVNRQVRTSNLAAATPLGQQLRAGLAARRPPAG